MANYVAFVSINIYLRFLSALVFHSLLNTIVAATAATLRAHNWLIAIGSRLLAYKCILKYFDQSRFGHSTVFAIAQNKFLVAFWGKKLAATATNTGIEHINALKQQNRKCRSAAPLAFARAYGNWATFTWPINTDITIINWYSIFFDANNPHQQLTMDSSINSSIVLLF